MQQKKFLLIDLFMGWFIFAIAAMTYALTIEPSASLWDCPEFIACGYKLQIAHPPGAPFFMLTGNLFSQFASNPSEVAKMMNLLSALLSAGCILFLFWTITYFARKLIISNNSYPINQVLLIEACGVVGSLAYTFSDTFWFSAVEGEVYAYSSFLTALVFWLILKWEEHAEDPSSDRWIILIAYLIGLSIGVHLLNLLCIPPMVLIVYYKKNQTITRKGTIMALGFGFFLIALVLYGIIPGVMKIGEWFELFFINVCGFPYNTGLIIYVILLSISLVFMIIKTKSRLWHTVVLCLTMILIGFSSYAVIIIRSSANPPMDENSPDNVFALSSYLNREQYGDKPLLYGNAYSSEIKYEPRGEYLVPVIKEGEAIYRPSKNENEHKYIAYEHKQELVYQDNMLFPRMYSSDYAKAYEQWMGGVDKRNNLPTQFENIRFFLSYQVNFMYWRYFLWNFVGRQNNIQGHGEVEHGNWITGISIIDDMILGCDTSKMPSDLRNNKGRNVFFGIPLILGLLGMMWQLRKGKKGHQQWNIIMLLFFMTGLAIVIYLNQTPYQPRERDYAYAGSFYAFTIWIGLGVAAVNAMLQKLHIKKGVAITMASILCTLVPIQMVSQTWDDHDRSDRYTCRDFGANYLNSTQKEGYPILLTNGDNDTFPLWYNQEVEGVRTDVRACNMCYAQTDWYVDQMKRPAYQSPALPKNWGNKESLVNDIINHCNGKRPIYACISIGGDFTSSLKDHLILEGLVYRISPDSIGSRVDIERLYYNIMNRFKYGNLKHPGIYVDDDVMRMANTHQHIMGILIDSLLEQGDLKRAYKVAEKWQKEMPADNVPYTNSALSMANCFYKIGRTEDGDKIVMNLLSRAMEWLKWIDTIKPDKKSGSLYSEKEWIETMQLALSTAYQNKRNKIIQQYEKFIKPYKSYGL